MEMGKGGANRQIKGNNEGPAARKLELGQPAPVGTVALAAE